jgi:PAS domain S-box-containing protein
MGMPIMKKAGQQPIARGGAPVLADVKSVDDSLSEYGLAQQVMEQMPFSITIVDATSDDFPLVYVNRAFEQMTGYRRDAVLGRNCRFLQGQDTCEADRRALREAMEQQRDASVDIVNYRANGERFLNRLRIRPIATRGSQVTHFIGIQNELVQEASYESKVQQLDQSLRELQHRVKNHLAMLLALIRLESRRGGDLKLCLGVLAHRVETLNLLYDELSLRGLNAGGTVHLGAYITRVASALKVLDSEHEVTVSVGAEPLEVPVEAASQVGLLVSELLTNALRHAFPDSLTGVVNVNFWQRGGFVYVQVCDTGRGLPDHCDWPEKGNLGARIVRDLSRRLDAELMLVSGPFGTHVTVKIPLAVFRRAE